MGIEAEGISRDDRDIALTIFFGESGAEGEPTNFQWEGVREISWFRTETSTTYKLSN